MCMFLSVEVCAEVYIHYGAQCSYSNSIQFGSSLGLIQSRKEQFCFMFLFLGIADFGFM